MQALHTHFFNPEGDLASLENYLKTAKRERKPKRDCDPGAFISLRTEGSKTGLGNLLSRFAFSGGDNERIRKREICLSLLYGRIG